ncbi:MAG: DUF971 domain-containing protein [Burkholderiaceae bacterium]|nr:DUF971 domain-containing protein [Burkholderiaceae bacterium]
MSHDQDTAAPPSSLTVHVKSRVMEVGYEDGAAYRIPFELMRVYSPSAEVMGHGPGQETLQVGKMHVIIESMEPVGHYGVKPKFSDGHESGIFSWDYIAWLGQNQDALWADYLARLAAAGASREPDLSGVATDSGGGCGKPGCGSGGCGSH